MVATAAARRAEVGEAALAVGDPGHRDDLVALSLGELDGLGMRVGDDPHGALREPRTRQLMARP
jgi:hypothetical protein